MASIQFPEINVPAGCEVQVAALLDTMRSQAALLSSPQVVSDAAMRAMTSSVEHSLSEGCKQAQVLAAGAKRKPRK